MNLDPAKREGKGRFSDAVETKLDDQFVHDTVKKAEIRTTTFDFLFVFFIGFWNVLKGFLLIDEQKTD